jgi:hypothetical protein
MKPLPAASKGPLLSCAALPISSDLRFVRCWRKAETQRFIQMLSQHWLKGRVLSDRKPGAGRKEKGIRLDLMTAYALEPATPAGPPFEGRLR